MVEKGGRKANLESGLLASMCVVEVETVPLAWNRRGRNRNDITTGGIGVNFGRPITYSWYLRRGLSIYSVLSRKNIFNHRSVDKSFAFVRCCVMRRDDGARYFCT